MKVLLYSLVLISVALAAHIGVGPSYLDGRIIGGNTTTIIDHPYQVAIEYVGSYRCGGAIIARTWILTAAHCVEDLTISSLRVRVGTTYRGIGGTVIQASNVYAHSNYSTTTFDFDIALIQLETFIDLSDSAQIIGLPNNGEAIHEGTLANVTGWGATTEGGSAATVLKAIEIPVIGQSVCRDLYSGYLVSERMFCAGLFEGGKDACAGDGGSPLVIDGVLSGLVSWGLGCARPESPGVYTNVSSLRNWITNQTGI